MSHKADNSEERMTDKERIDFLAELANLDVLKGMGAMLTAEKVRMLTKGSETILRRYELHRRDHDTPRAFRLAVDDAISTQYKQENERWNRS